MTTYSYYIDYINGDDGNSGDEGSPWKTLVKAKTVLETYYAVNVYVNLYLEPGVHYVEAPFIILNMAGTLNIIGRVDSNGVFPTVLIRGSYSDLGYRGQFDIRMYELFTAALSVKRIIFKFYGYVESTPTPTGDTFAANWRARYTEVSQCAFLGRPSPITNSVHQSGLKLFANAGGSHYPRYFYNCVFDHFYRGVMLRAYYDPTHPYASNILPYYFKNCSLSNIRGIVLQTPDYVGVLEVWPFFDEACALKAFNCNFYNCGDYLSTRTYKGKLIHEYTDISTLDPSFLNQAARGTIANYIEDRIEVPVPGAFDAYCYPVQRHKWAQSGSVDSYTGSAFPVFDYVLGDCGDTVYIESPDAIAIDADTRQYLVIEGVVQMQSGDDNNNPFIQYKIGSTWYTKILGQNDLYVFDSALDIENEQPQTVTVDMSGEGDWSGTVTQLRFGAWKTAVAGQDPRSACLHSIIPLTTSTYDALGFERIYPDSDFVDVGIPALFDDYIDSLFAYIGRGVAFSDIGVYGGVADESHDGEASARLGRAVGEPESSTPRTGYVTTEGLLLDTRGGRCVGAEPSITTVGFTSMSERLIELGDMRKSITGQTLQRTACDSTTAEFDNEDSALYDEDNEEGILYPTTFDGTLTAVANDILRDTAQDFTGFTLTGFCEILSGKAIGKRYYIIFSDTNSWAVLPDFEDSFSTNPEADGVQAGDFYRIDASYEIWFQIHTGYRNLPSDRLLWMGGIANQKQIDHALASKSVIARILGFEKVLETYDAFDVCREEGLFYFISGIKALRYVPSAYTPLQYGPRIVEFKWKSARIEGAEIYEVQVGNKPGLKTLEYRPPYYFRYDGGPWYERQGEQTEYLYDAEGNTISVKHSGRYPDECGSIFFIVQDEYKPYVHKEGLPTLRLGEGLPIELSRSFVAVLLHENGSWTDITDRVTYGKHVNVDENSLVSCLAGYDSEIYLLCSKPFTGFDLTLDKSSTFSGWLSYMYWRGGDYTAFDADELTDETSNFFNNGKVTWNIPHDWVRTDVYAGALDTYRAVYAIKVRKDSMVSGTAVISQIQRAFRVMDSDGMGVDVAVSHDQIPLEDVEDAVVIKKNGIIGSWYHMIDYHTLAQRAATAFGFPESCRTIDAMKYTWDSDKIGVWGKLPRITGSNKIPTALAWDDQTSTLYVGLEDELWQVPENGDAERIAIVPRYEEFILHIFRLTITQDSGCTYVRGVAWKPYDDKYYNIDENTPQSDDNNAWMNAPACAFSCDTEQYTFVHSFLEATAGWDGEDYASLYPGVMTTRSGSQKPVVWSPSSTYKDCMVGQAQVDGGPMEAAWPNGAGENIIVPFTHNNYLRLGPYGVKPGMYQGHALARKRTDIFGSGRIGNAYGDWGFQWSLTGGGWSMIDTKGPFWLPSAGFYSLQDNVQDSTVGYFQPMWKLGQPGYVVWDPTNKKWIGRLWDGNPSTTVLGDAWYDKYFDHLGNTTTRSTQGNTPHAQVLHAAWDSTNQTLYASMIWWRDHFQNELINSRAWIVKLTEGGFEDKWLFYSGDAFEEGSAMSINVYTMALELCYSVQENVFHGCILDRTTLKYYYMVYDHINNKMYAIDIGSNPYYQLKSFAYNANDKKMYFAVCDVRFGQVGAVIMRADFDASRTAGEWLEVEEVGTPDENEFDIPTMIAASDRVLGFTGPHKGNIFQISSTFYPRIQYADLSDMNGREMFEHLCAPLGMHMRVHEDNTIKIKDLHL